MADQQTFEIRQAAIEDYDKIASIELESYGSSNYSYVVLRQLIDVAPELFLVAEGSCLFGFIAGLLSTDHPGSGWILSLLVSTSHRRQGVGSALVAELLSRFYDLGVMSVYLTVAPTKTGAQKVYTDLGFSCKKKESDYFGLGEDRLIYAKQLTPPRASLATINGNHAKVDDFKQTTDVIQSRVHQYYWKDNLNCATVVLKNLSETFGISLNQQVLDAAIGMHGAGGFRAQCGLVEGTLLFIGIFGKTRNISDQKIVELCRLFAQAFEHEFASLLCRELRPEGFTVDNPPHLCEQLTIRANLFSISFIRTRLLSELVNSSDC